MGIMCKHQFGVLCNIPATRWVIEFWILMDWAGRFSDSFWHQTKNRLATKRLDECFWFALTRDSNRFLGVTIKRKNLNYSQIIFFSYWILLIRTGIGLYLPFSDWFGIWPSSVCSRVGRRVHLDFGLVQLERKTVFFYDKIVARSFFLVWFWQEAEISCSRLPKIKNVQASLGEFFFYLNHVEADQYQTVNYHFPIELEPSGVLLGSRSIYFTFSIFKMKNEYNE